MNCELCGAEIQHGNFGDVDGAIVCPKCMGWTGTKPDSEVALFLERNGEEPAQSDKKIHPDELKRHKLQEEWFRLNGPRLEEERKKWQESPEYQRLKDRHKRSSRDVKSNFGTRKINMKTDETAQRKAGRVTHPRWRLWMMAVSDAKEKGASRLTKSINYWGAHVKKKGGDYNDVLEGVLSDVGTYLNMTTSKIGDYRVSIPMVSKMFNLEASIVKQLFFEKGALAQSLLPFDISTVKQGHADTLLRMVEEYQSAGEEFNVVKNEVVGMARSLRTKNPQHRMTLLSIVEKATDYDKLRGGLIQAKLSFEGMGAEIPLAASKQATITVVLPWKFKNTIKAAQSAAKFGKIRISGSVKGCEVRGTIHNLADLGIVKTADARSLMGPVRQAGVSTMEGVVWNLPGGKQAVEIATRLNSRTSALLSSQLVTNRKLVFATIYDKTGTPHTSTLKKAAEIALENDFLADDLDNDQIDDFDQSLQSDEFIPEEYEDQLFSKKASRKASLVTSLRKVWEEIAPEFGEALDLDEFEPSLVRELVGDNASNYLTGAALLEWNSSEAEEKTNALQEAFATTNNLQKIQQRHLDRRSVGAKRVQACGCDSHDPTDFLDQDDTFNSPLQEMILEPSQHSKDSGIVIIEIPG